MTEQQTPKQRIKEAWKEGMLYKFYFWLSQKSKVKTGGYTNEKNKS